MPVFKQIMPETSDAPKGPKIRLVVIFFGANDSVLPFGPQHVPLKTYAENLSNMVEMILDPSSSRYSADTKVIIVTPPPVNEVQWKKRCDEDGNPLDRSKEVTKAYAEAAKDVAKQHNVPSVDLWSEIMNMISPSGVAVNGNGSTQSNGKTSHHDLSEFLYDGLHMNALGNQVFYDALMHTIKTELPDLHPDSLPIELPEFFDLPQEEYEEALVFKNK